MYTRLRLQRDFIPMVVLAIVICSLSTMMVGEVSGQDIAPDGHGFQDDQVQSGPNYVPGELVLKIAFPDSITVDEVNAMFGLTTARYFEELGIYVLSAGVEANLDSLSSLIEETLPWVLFAHPNYRVDPLQPVQGSFPFSDQQGIGSFDDQTAAMDLDLASAHSIADGSGVKVAVIDGGIDLEHTAFDGMAIHGYDFIDEDFYAFDERGGENSGHGTFVAGVVHLVAPGAQIVAYRVSEADGSSDGDLVARAILKAVHDGCRVINISLVVMEEHEVLKEAIQYARDHNVLVVVAAGNEQVDEPLYPAGDPNVLAVAAVDSIRNLTDYSRYGDYIDLCAPGNNVYSPHLDGYYAWWSGTSFAAPFVAGQAALLISKNPDYYDWQRVRDAITGNAIDIDPLNPEFEDKLGAGLIDPVASLSLWPDSAVIYELNTNFEVDEGSTDILTGLVVVWSSNDPAPYTVTTPGPPTFVTLPTDTGFTIDSLFFTVDPTGLAPGFYADTLVFNVAGVDNNPVLSIATLTVNGSSTGPDTMAVLPPTQTFYASGADSLGPQLGSVTCYSTNAPANFMATLFGTTEFLHLITESGVTTDSVWFEVYEDTLPAGTYVDSIELIVEGVSNNPQYAEVVFIVGAGGFDSAGVLPSQRVFHVDEGTPAFDTACFLVYSTNAPAPYTLEYLNPPTFLNLPYEVGVTDEYLCFEVRSDSLPVGHYADTVLFYVDGVVNNPVMCAVHLFVDPLVPPPDSAGTTPEQLVFFDTLGSTEVQSAWVYVWSIGDTVPYTAQVAVDTEVVFTTITDDPGMTNDHMRLEVDPTGLTMGNHINYIWFQVDGFDDFLMRVQLMIDTIPDDTVVTEDSAYIAPCYRHPSGFTIEEGSSEVFTDCFHALSTNAPAAFTVSMLNTPNFVTLLDESGTTNDTVSYQVSGPTLPPGTYMDIIALEVEGVANSPVLEQITLTVLPAGTGPDSAWVEPPVLNFIADPYEEILQSGYVFLSSTNAPAAFTAGVIGGGPTPFATVVDSAGFTNDSVLVTITGSSLSPGTYYEYIAFDVEGIADAVSLTVAVNVGDTVTTQDSAWIWSNDLFWTMQEGSGAVDTGFLIIESTNQPAEYWISFGGDIKFTSIPFEPLVNEETPDSVMFIVDVGTLTAGVYADTLLFYVDSCVNNPIPAIIQLTVTPSGPVPDSAFVMPYELFFTAAYGSDVIETGYAFLSSTNAPASYTAEVVVDTELVFAAPVAVSGTTDDSVAIEVNPSGLTVGWHTNWIRYTVAGVTDPVYLTINLVVDTVPSGGDSAVVYPALQQFTKVEGDTVNQEGWVTVFSSNAPALYTIEYTSQPKFTVLPQWLSAYLYTNDSIPIGIEGDTLAAGIYADTLLFDVTGTYNSPVVAIVTLNVVPAGSTSVIQSLVNYPNPFNPETNMLYSLARAAHVELTIYNVLGQEVTKLVDDYMPAGEHSVVWDGRSENGARVSTGVYFYRLSTGSETKTKKMILLE